MKNFELKVIKNGEQNELVYIKINRNVYTKSMLTFGEISLLEAMSYDNYKCNYKYFESLSTILGYNIVTPALKSLKEKGANIISDEDYRKLVMNSYKNKYNGLMR